MHASVHHCNSVCAADKCAILLQLPATHATRFFQCPGSQSFLKKRLWVQIDDITFTLDEEEIQKVHSV